MAGVFCDSSQENVKPNEVGRDSDYVHSKQGSFSSFSFFFFSSVYSKQGSFFEHTKLTKKRGCKVWGSEHGPYVFSKNKTWPRVFS
jgi:hypothetical protein